MKRKMYHLDYQFIGGSRHLQTPNLAEFSKALDKAMDDPYVAENTIEFKSEEVDVEPEQFEIYG